LRALGFEGVTPEATGRPAYHPATMLKIYVYGYINQIQSSRRLERETARNVQATQNIDPTVGVRIKF
jgi:transposase